MMERVTAGLHVLLYISETVLQVLTALRNVEIATTYCWLIVAFLVVSSLITNSVSLAWVYKGMDFADRRTGECLCIGLHTFQLGIPWRYLKLWLAGDHKDSRELVVLRLLQTSIQSGPFLILQTWLTLDMNLYSRLSLAALAVSIVSLAYTYASNTEPLHKVLQVHQNGNSSVIQFATRFFCHCFIMVARFLAIAIFGLLTRSWLVLALVGHFVISTVIMIIHNFWKTPPHSKPNKIVILTTLQSFGCTFAPVPFSKMSYPYLLYFIVIFLENLVMSTVWFIQRKSTPENVVLYTISLTSFLTGFIIACIYSKTLGVFRVTSDEESSCGMKSSKCVSGLPNQKRHVKDKPNIEISNNNSFIIDLNDSSGDIRPKTSSLKSLGNASGGTSGLSALDDLDEVLPSSFLKKNSSTSQAHGSTDSGVVANQAQTDSICSTSNKTESSLIKTEAENLPKRQVSLDSISSGCCSDTSIGSCSNMQTPDVSLQTELSHKCNKGDILLHSTPKIRAIEITEAERILIDSLLKTGECLLDKQDVDLSSSGCFGESSSEYSNVSTKLVFDECGERTNDTEAESGEITSKLPCMDSVPAKEAEDQLTPNKPNEVIHIETYCADSDMFSTTYQTISSCPSDFPHHERRLPSLTSSITRTWADAALSSSTSTCDTCTTCRESFERSCSDSVSWSSEDTLDLVESDTDCMTWPPRKVDIVNLHDLPREKLSLDDRISKWLGEVTIAPRYRETPPLQANRGHSSSNLEVHKKLVYVNSRANDCYIKSAKRTKPFALFNVKTPTGSKKQLAVENRPLSRSYSLNFIMKLCNAASFRRKKVILFNHLREECQRHRDPFNSGFAVS